MGSSKRNQIDSGVKVVYCRSPVILCFPKKKRKKRVDGRKDDF